MDTLAHLRLEGLSSRNEKMARCLKLAALAASSDVPVLILGETGTGKTLLARAIHNSSARARGPFISFNASAISDTLLESELFGHERGAFTGAHHAAKGKFELAHSGTLFFDEIADMSALAQAKILRAVEYGEFERVGGQQVLRSDARIITATNCSLRGRIREGRFREDLYHRLEGLVLLIPALRERTEELASLIAIELKAAAAETGKRITSIHPAAMELLLSYSWPGNLRELHHTMRTVTLFCEGQVVQPEHVVFQPDLSPGTPPCGEETPAAVSINGPATAGGPLTLDQVVRQHARSVYETTGRNQRKAARVLGISRGKLARLLRSQP
jgi:DNA-binding NtrC family response regulator